MILFYVGHAGVIGSQSAPELIYRDMIIQNFPRGACPYIPLDYGRPLTVVHLVDSNSQPTLSKIPRSAPVQGGGTNTMCRHVQTSGV